MAANRRKTIEYAFATRITALATNTTLATATRHDTAALTLFIPETASRRFLSVRLTVTYRTQYTATNNITGWRMGIKLGAAATGDTDRVITGVGTANKNVFDVVDLDVTDYFNANFGAGSSQSCVASLAVATTTASNINGVTFKLIITYEFDATAQPTRIKTIRIPIQSQTTTLTTTQQEIGTDGTNPAPSNQIPALDTFLPEAGKVYRQIFLESAANDCAVAVTPTAFTPFLQIDTATEIARATVDETLSTTLVWRDVVDLTGSVTTSAPHALKLRCDLTARLGSPSSTLVVTYEYDASATTSILCEALVPLTMSNDDTPGIAIGESFSSNVAADAQSLIAALAIPEASPVIRQSAVYLNCMSYNTSVNVNASAGGQSFRSYLIGGPNGGAVGDSPVIHRVDHGGGWTLARGDNRLALRVYNSVPVRCDLTGYALVHYTAAAPSDPDAATHVVNYVAATYGTGLQSIVDIAASSAGLRAPVLGAPYRLQAMMIDQYCRAQSGLSPQLLVEQRAEEWDGAGFITLPLRHSGVLQQGSWRLTWALTRAFNHDHLHTGKLNLETARRQVIWNPGGSLQASWSWWVTYHQLTFPVAGKVTVGSAPAASGKPVEIFARDSRNNVELVASTTTDASGAFSIAATDATRSYFASYQDGAVLGRSASGTPGATAFDIGIPVGPSTLASASDATGQILPGGDVQLSWSYPGDITAQGVVFDVYQSPDPTDLFRSLCAAQVAALTVQLPAASVPGDRYFSVVARRGVALALPARPAFVAVPVPAANVPARTTVSAAGAATGVGFPFGISPTGGVIAQGGDALLRGKILQLLLTAPGERVNRPDYGTRLLDLVFDPSSEVLAATTEFTITRALQQTFADEIQLDTVQVTASDDTLLVDISYLRKSDLTLEQVRVGVPLPQGASP